MCAWCQSCHILPRVQTFMGPWKLCRDYFWGREHCALLANVIKPRLLVVIEESGSAFAMVGARYQILASDVCLFGYKASAKLAAFSVLVWWGSFSSLVRWVRVREEGGAGPNQRQVAEVDINKNNVFSLGIYTRTRLMRLCFQLLKM